MKGQRETDSGGGYLGTLITDIGLFLCRKFGDFLVEADVLLGDIVRGDWYCSSAVLYGRYVPCGGDKCGFHYSNPAMMSIYW